MKNSANTNLHNYLPDISLFIATLVWGSTFTVLKVVLGNDISPVLFVFIRFSLAAILLYPICRKRLRGLGKDGISGGILLGILIYAGFLTQSLGIGTTTASKAAFITGLSAIFVPLFLFLHKGKFPQLLSGIAIVIATFGMYMLTGPSGGGFTFGDFLVLLCAVSFGAQIYFMGVITVGRDALALTFVELATTVVLSALSLPFENMKLNITWASLGAIAFMSILPTFGGLLVQAWAQKKTNAVRVGLIFTAEPVFAYVFAFFLLGENFNTIQLIGAAIIILAVLTSEVLPMMMGNNKEV